MGLEVEIHCTYILSLITGLWAKVWWRMSDHELPSASVLINQVLCTAQEAKGLSSKHLTPLPPKSQFITVSVIPAFLHPTQRAVKMQELNPLQRICFLPWSESAYCMPALTDRWIIQIYLKKKKKRVFH